MTQTLPQHHPVAAPALPNFNASTSNSVFDPNDSSSSIGDTSFVSDSSISTEDLVLSTDDGDVSCQPSGSPFCRDTSSAQSSQELVATSLKSVLSDPSMRRNLSILSDVFHHDANHSADDIANKITTLLHERVQGVVTGMVEAAIKVHLLKTLAHTSPPVGNLPSPDVSFENPCFNVWNPHDEVKSQKDLFFLLLHFRKAMRPNLPEGIAPRNFVTDSKDDASTLEEDSSFAESPIGASEKINTSPTFRWSPTTLLTRPQVSSLTKLMQTRIIIFTFLLLAIAVQFAYGFYHPLPSGSDFQEPHRLWAKYREEAHADQFFLSQSPHRPPFVLLEA